MDEKQRSLSDEVIIEIVHSIKDIVIELIDRSFPKKENKQEENEKIRNSRIYRINGRDW